MTSRIIIDMSAPDFGGEMKRLESHLMDEATADRVSMLREAAMTVEERAREATVLSRWVARCWGG